MGVRPELVPDPARRLAELLDALRQTVAGLPAEQLPELFAGLEGVRWTARLRLESAALPVAQPGPPELLTVEAVSRVLAVTPATVYRLAKTGLRSAAVDVGEGTLRFDPEKLRRFVEARRR